MNKKRILLIVADVVIGVYLLFAMTAFNKPDANSAACENVVINIQQETSEGFLSNDEVKQLLLKSRIYPLGKDMNDVNTRAIEEALENNDLIESAECYKTQTGNVCIDVKQRIPVIRVMAEDGGDYYVDNHSQIVPHTNYSCNLIVATGHISKDYARKVLGPVAKTILADDFWKNEIVQLNVLQDGSMEMVPRVGDHIVYLGQPTGISHKLERLFKFYRYGLSEAGWNKYSQVSVEFDNQIICKRKKR